MAVMVRLDAVGLSASSRPHTDLAMSELFFPAMYFIARYAMCQSVTRLMAQRLAHQRHAAVRIINEIFTSTIINVTVNVVIFLVAVYGLRSHLPHKQLVLVITTVYAGSVLHVVIKCMLNAYWIYDISRYLLRHGIYGPRAWLHSHIAGEVHARFRRMGFLGRLVYGLTGAPREAELIELLTRDILKVVLTKVLATLAILVIYVTAFTLTTRPVLLEEATGMNWMQAFL